MAVWVVREDACPECGGKGCVACNSAAFDRLCLRCEGRGRVRREVSLLDALVELQVIEALGDGLYRAPCGPVTRES